MTTDGVVRGLVPCRPNERQFRRCNLDPTAPLFHPPAALGLVTLVGLCTPTATIAEEGDSFICEIKGGGRFKDAFPEILGVAIGSEGAIIRDPIINYYHDGPIPAQIKSDTDARLSLRWIVDITNESTGYTAIDMHTIF